MATGTVLFHARRSSQIAGAITHAHISVLGVGLAATTTTTATTPPAAPQAAAVIAEVTVHAAVQAKTPREVVSLVLLVVINDIAEAHWGVSAASE